MFKALLQLTNFTLGPDATLNTEIHKTSVRIKATSSINASKRKHKNQINHYNKQRPVLKANSTVHKIAALPRHEEEEETDKPNKRKSNKRMKSTKTLFPSEVIAILKGLQNTRTKLHKARHKPKSNKE